MSEQIFEVGQTVRLKSGGPLMTIEGINAQNPNFVTCIWFDNEKIMRQQFLMSLIKHDDDGYVVI